MVNRGFLDCITTILENCHLNETQVVIFRESNDHSEYLERYIPSLLPITVIWNEGTVEGLRQFYLNCERQEWKIDTLVDLFDTIEIDQAIIYARTRTVMYVVAELNARGYVCNGIDKSMSREEVNTIVKDFRSGTFRVLVCSTESRVARSSINLYCLSIMYDLPINWENYVHLIGRSGKFGRKGVVICFITQHERQQILDLERYYNTVIEELPANIKDFV